MKIPVKYLELHSGTALFMDGNLGTKILPDKKPGMTIHRDLTDGSVYIQYRGKLIILERTSVFSWMPENPSDMGIKIEIPKLEPMVASPPVNDALAQQARMQAIAAKSNQQNQGLTSLRGAPKYKPLNERPKLPKIPQPPSAQVAQIPSDVFKTEGNNE